MPTAPTSEEVGQCRHNASAFISHGETPDEVAAGKYCINFFFLNTIKRMGGMYPESMLTASKRNALSAADGAEEYIDQFSARLELPG